MTRRRSAVSILSDSIDMDFDGIAETEIGKLQRQFRITEGDRQAYSIQSQEIIRKQRQEISKLREEQEELLRSLRVVECQACKQSDSQDAQSLRLLLNQRDDLDKQLERKRQTQAELEQVILSVEKKLAELRRGEITVSHSHMSQTRHTQKVTSTLENKLDRALVCFNKQLTKNSQLREEIETLCMERIQFQQLRCKLEKVLQDIRRDIGEVINMSTSAYDARLEAQTKMSMMKEKAVKDLAQYTAEMKELERVIAHESKLKKFMTTKSNERSVLEDGQEISHRHEMKEQRKADSGVEAMDTLEEVFQQIQRVTREDDLEMLVTKFIRVEDRNFALFNYVNEQNAETVKLREEIQQIGEEMNQFHSEGLQQEQKYQEDLKRVKDLQKECEKQAQQYKAQADDISKILDQIKTGVDSLFDKLDSDQALVEDPGSPSGIRDSNIMTYLSLAEQRTSELLTIHAFINSKDQEKSYDPKVMAQYLLGQTPEDQRKIVIIQPPVARDNDEAEDSPITDEEDHPLSETVLRLQIRSWVKMGLCLQEGAEM
ncbi:coiled-coil domain-containing protein 63-like [Myxocyprinus asiaticus]|uniref:coiled-coil domain-containing protein 63-like n=1 Tax=Myxocyprinus asiaticus TaxID=70543 RepID=UPI0022214438|nr:coiled-coil domain-containing protein 63-like [Myxocyprinus asiaticus]